MDNIVIKKRMELTALLTVLSSKKCKNFEFTRKGFENWPYKHDDLQIKSMNDIFFDLFEKS